MIMLRTRECVCERETENPTIENCLFYYYFFTFSGFCWTSATLVAIP